MKKSRVMPICKVLLEKNIIVGKRYWVDTAGENGYIIEISDICYGEFLDQDGQGDTLRSLFQEYNVHKVPDNTPLGYVEEKYIM